MTYSVKDGVIGFPITSPIKFYETEWDRMGFDEVST